MSRTHQALFILSAILNDCPSPHGFASLPAALSTPQETTAIFLACVALTVNAHYEYILIFWEYFKHS